MATEINPTYLKLNDMFKLNIDKQLLNSSCHFESFHEIKDLVNENSYYVAGLDNVDLRFQDRAGLFEVLIKFVDRAIANIPNELEALESQRQSRDFDDYRHFYDTEALSEKEGKLMSIKNQLLKSKKK
ncbi:MAG: hypothetical protein JWR50_3153 [Mucilaginibacter sp.]|nr:hypothetical protein [Mucilaginibacter sp.]